jgi:hypothetical protein
VHPAGRPFRPLHRHRRCEHLQRPDGLGDPGRPHRVPLDGYGTAHTDTLAQKVTIPATCKNAMFTYWAEVNSSVTGSQQAQNTLVLEVLNSSGAVVQTVPVATAANNGSSYVEHSTNLASYLGQTITLKFIGTEVSGGNTSFFEDTNALNVS